ncbi:MAG: Holliday junction resolvase RuvX [Halioglobus sp.]
MAFDFGLRQIGVAIGNCLLTTTQPLAILSARDGIPDWQAVSNLLQEWKPDLLLVGNPLNMDGTESDLGARARKFGNRLHGRFGLPVEFADERLTSFEAKQDLAASGHSGDYKAQPIDSYAAELILKSWMRTAVG